MMSPLIPLASIISMQSSSMLESNFLRLGNIDPRICFLLSRRTFANCDKGNANSPNPRRLSSVRQGAEVNGWYNEE
ncbi:hypothetical protein AX14_002359 [Amanita brunnescens Koide BX004]|nr:hypothetical protein AX14_002359 [Amanita brunnescens Koide BX004]